MCSVVGEDAAAGMWRADTTWWSWSPSTFVWVPGLSSALCSEHLYPLSPPDQPLFSFLQASSCYIAPAGLVLSM